MNIHVKRPCSWAGIGRIVPFPHNVLMENTKKPHYLREWRKFRSKTLVQAAEYLHMSHGSLSKIERGQVPYNQKLLEKLAELYMCEPADLIIRDPSEPIDIWSIWDQAKPGDKRKIVSVAKTIVGDSEAA
jgi:DNA-binding XRE family transcriptional regulator